MAACWLSEWMLDAKLKEAAWSVRDWSKPVVVFKRFFEYIPLGMSKAVRGSNIPGMDEEIVVYRRSLPPIPGM